MDMAALACRPGKRCSKANLPMQQGPRKSKDCRVTGGGGLFWLLLWIWEAKEASFADSPTAWTSSSTSGTTEMVQASPAGHLTALIDATVVFFRRPCTIDVSSCCCFLLAEGGLVQQLEVIKLLGLMSIAKKRSNNLQCTQGVGLQPGQVHGATFYALEGARTQ